MFKMGWKQSSGDLGVSSFKISNNIKSLAANNTQDQYLITEYIKPYNQGQIGSCVANSTCAAFEILKGLEDPNNIQMLSRLFVYYNARNYTNATNLDEGCFIHNALDSLTKLGVCLESAWEYNSNKVFEQPNQLAYKQGDDNTLTDFYQITSSDSQRLQEVEAAIRSNHPVIFGTQVGKDLENYTGEDIAFNPPSDSLGGHAMLITGVRRNPDLQFYIRNSWGESWGIEGHCWFSAEYIAWDQTWDLFVPTKMSNLLL